MSALTGIAGRMPHLATRGRWGRLNALLGAALAGVGVLTYLVIGTHSSTAAATTRTASAQRGVVLSSVTASGAVEPATQLSLNFQSSGLLKSVGVKAGQHVRAGQTLGTLDSTTAAAAVQQAQASLAGAKAALQTTLTGETAAQRRQDSISLQQAKASVTTAKASLASATASAKLDLKTAQASLAQAQQQLRADQANEAVAVAQKKKDLGTYADQAAVEAAVAVAQAQVTADQTLQHQHQSAQFDLQAQQTVWNQQLAADKALLNTSAQANDQATLDSIARQLQDSAKTLSNDTYQLSVDQNALSTIQTTLTAVKADQSSIVSYEAKADSDRIAIANAETSLAGTKVKSAQSIESAQQQVAAANLSVSSTAASVAVKQAAPLASAVAQNNAAIVQAETSLAAAERTLSETVLKAPVAGVVASVSGAPGTQVAGGGSTFASSSSSSSSTSSSSSGSSGFIELVGVKAMQVKASFSETDAAKIHLGQPATVTVSALTNVTLAAHVTAVNVTPTTSSSGVVQYDVTFTLDRTASQLKAGMTASVSVTVAQAANAVHVPTAAVTGTGANARVTVLSNGKQQTVPVVAGLTGDTSTQIVSGLREGQTVVLPSTPTSTAGQTSTTQGGGLRGGGLGGGGGGIGGGFPRG